MNKEKLIDYSSLNKKPNFKPSFKKYIAAKNNEFGGIILFSFILFALFLQMIGANVDNDSQVKPALYAFIAIISVIIVGIYISYKQYATDTEKYFKTLDFVETNKFIYLEDVNNPQYNGLIFKQGHSKKILQAVQVVLHNTTLELGNYNYISGSGKNSQSHPYFYIKFKLPRKLPHIILDAKQNNALNIFSNLPMMVNLDQKMSLEGDFNNHYTLYAPNNYERDTLYLFTPDVMEVFKTYATNYDAEIIDDELYFFNYGHIDLSKEAVYKEAMQLFGKVYAQLHHQADYYMDTNIQSRAINQVADKGARLKSSKWPYIAFFAIGIYLAFLFSFGSGTGGSFFYNFVFFCLFLAAIFYSFFGIKR